MVATRRGIEATTFMVMPWPRSRSSLYPVVRRGGGRCLPGPGGGGQARLLPYVGRFRTGESTGRMLEIVNARLDELWAWGVEHGSSPASRPALSREANGDTAGLR